MAGSGSGTVTGKALVCNSNCSTTLAANTTFTLQATPAAGSVFDGWGGACAGSQTQCTVTLSQARSVTAGFVPADLRNAAVDALIAGMPANSWKALPSTQMKDVCPSPYQAYFCANVITAWSGGAYDDKRDRMIVYGGGHSDSWYNNVFAFDLAVMKWQRLTEMSAGADGANPGPGWNDSRLESCGYYPKSANINLPASVMMAGKPYVDYDKCFVEPVVSQLNLQQPRSDHTYGKVFVDTVNDRYCYYGGGAYPGAQVDDFGIDCLDPQTRLWERVARRPADVYGRGQVAVDAKGLVWYLTAEGAPITAYNTATRQFQRYGYVNYETGGGTDIDRQRNHMYALASLADGSYALRRFDLNNTASLQAKTGYTQITASGTAPNQIGTRPGFAYADSRDRFYAWGGGRNVYVYDPQTQAWSTAAGTGDDPGAQQNWGTYGRFRWSGKRGVFVLVNSTTQDVMIYKPGN
ncbi:InlB B-repeat-containing protein [Roseateles aquae]